MGKNETERQERPGREYRQAWETRHEVRYQGFERGKSAGGSGGAPATHRRGEAAGEEKLPAQLSSSEGHVQHGLRIHLGVQTSRQRRRVARVPNREVEHENQAADRAPQGAHDRSRDEKGLDGFAEPKEQAPQVLVQ